MKRNYYLVMKLEGKTHSEAKFEASEYLGFPVEIGKLEDKVDFKVVEMKDE